MNKKVANRQMLAKRVNSSFIQLDISHGFLKLAVS